MPYCGAISSKLPMNDYHRGIAAFVWSVHSAAFFARSWSSESNFPIFSFSPLPVLPLVNVHRLLSDHYFLRVSTVSSTQSVFIYYGASPNFTNCTSNGAATNQSDVNMVNRPELRYDTSQILGGTIYDSYAHALTLVGSMPIMRATLVLDRGWAGDHVIDPVANATVDDNTFVPLSAGYQEVPHSRRRPFSCSFFKNCTG
jgi:hypothetical protein